MDMSIYPISTPLPVSSLIDFLQPPAPKHAGTSQESGNFAYLILKKVNIEGLMARMEGFAENFAESLGRRWWTWGQGGGCEWTRNRIRTNGTPQNTVVRRVWPGLHIGLRDILKLRRPFLLYCVLMF